MNITPYEIIAILCGMGAAYCHWGIVHFRKAIRTKREYEKAMRRISQNYGKHPVNSGGHIGIDI